ncbi:urea transporter [Propioniciclava flava]
MTSIDTAAPVTVRGVAENAGTGVGQIFFQESWQAGALIVLGIAVYSLPMAAMTVAGTLIATASARLVGLPTAHGLQGYCGALVGAAAWATFGDPWPAALATVLGAAACPAVTRALAWLLALVPSSAGSLSVLTAPFCVVSGIVALLAAAIAPGPAAAVAAPVAGDPLPLLGVAVLTGVSQVVLVESWLGGLLMLAGLFVANWRVGVAGLVGSLLGTLTALMASAGAATLTAGLAGYSPCLTAIGLACVFLRPGPLAWVLAAVGAVATVGVQALLALTPVPVYTWPFILTTWAMLLICRRWRG